MLAVAVGIMLVLTAAVAGTTYLLVTNRYVYIEKAQITAPTVELAPGAAGTLKSLNVTAGEIVPPNTVVAQVGVQLIKTTAGGLVLATHGDIGKSVPAGQSVVEMIDPKALRVVGSVQENKGLADIKVGQTAVFTVDAFGGKQYTGVVDEIAPQAASNDVVFSISDKRQEQNFDVKVRFDTQQYPELKQGMSAKLWIYK
jgi:multidrug resistance efflux pump